MNRKTVAEIRENELVESTFLVKSKASSVGRTGRPFLSLVLMDSTGEIEARVWDDAPEWEKVFAEGDFIKARGKVNTYQGRLQINISELRRCFDDEVRTEDFYPRSRRTPEEMFRELLEVIGLVQDPHLQALLNQIFSDPEISEGFKFTPAAKSIHHVFRGGLLEHTLSVTKLAQKLISHYRDSYSYRIDADLLLAGAILHDIGKVREIHPSGGFNYTTEGRLLGHISIGVSIIEEKIKTLAEFPPQLATMLKHMILSHHGLQEYGSPQEPMTLEAMILYYLDDLDSKVESIYSHLESDKSKGDDWSSFHRAYNRFFYKGKNT